MQDPGGHLGSGVQLHHSSHIDPDRPRAECPLGRSWTRSNTSRAAAPRAVDWISAAASIRNCGGPSAVGRRGRPTGAGSAGPVSRHYGFLGRRTPRKVLPLPGVVGVLARLEAAGVRQTVVTGNIEAVALLELHAANLIPPIDPTLGGYGDSGTTRVEVARSALDLLELAGWTRSLDRCWIVGDTPRDLQCARALGIRCALVATGRHSVEPMADLGADVLPNVGRRRCAARPVDRGGRHLTAAISSIPGPIATRRRLVSSLRMSAAPHCRRVVGDLRQPSAWRALESVGPTPRPRGESSQVLPTSMSAPRAK